MNYLASKCRNQINLNSENDIARGNHYWLIVFYVDQKGLEFGSLGTQNLSENTCINLVAGAEILVLQYPEMVCSFFPLNSNSRAKMEKYELINWVLASVCSCHYFLFLSPHWACFRKVSDITECAKLVLSPPWRGRIPTSWAPSVF